MLDPSPGQVSLRGEGQRELSKGGRNGLVQFHGWQDAESVEQTAGGWQQNDC